MENIIVKIYALINPINDQVFYIGATTNSLNKRLQEHVNDMKSSLHMPVMVPKKRILKSILESSLYPQILELDEVALMESTFFEDFYMNLFRTYGFNIQQEQKSRFATLYIKRMNSFELKRKHKIGA